MIRYSSPVGGVVFIAALLLSAACTALALTGFLAPGLAALSLVPLFVTIATGVAFPASGVFANAVMRGHADRAELALTFDDGPDPRWTPAILDLLDAHEQRATFFLIGERAERHPELVREIARRGHELANHTWSHSYLTVFTAPKSLAVQLDRTNGVIEAQTGKRPQWFRAPLGMLSPRIPIATSLAGLRLVSWTATARDGARHPTVSRAMKRLERALVPGSILVLHDGRTMGYPDPITGELLAQLLDMMAARGLRSVTLSDICRDR